MLKAVVCKESWDDDGLETVSVGCLKNRREIGPAMTGRNPIGSNGLPRLRPQKLVGAIGDTQSRKDTAAILDELGAVFDKRCAVFEIEHRVDFVFERFAPIRIW